MEPDTLPLAVGAAALRGSPSLWLEIRISWRTAGIPRAAAGIAIRTDFLRWRPAPPAARGSHREGGRWRSGDGDPHRWDGGRPSGGGGPHSVDGGRLARAE